jgi:thiol-disulfide isomerase/thioredoxin
MSFGDDAMHQRIVATRRAVCATAAFAAIFIVAAGAGCNKTNHGATLSSSSTQTSSVAGAEDAVSLKILDFDGLERLIAGKRGKVVVVDVWSTSCPPCVKSFPDLVALQRRIGLERLACISLSVDYEGTDPTEKIARVVRDFLTKQRATFDNVLASEEVFAMLRKLGVSAPPAVFVYDRDGKLREKFTEAGGKQRTMYEQVEALVVQLVK